MSGKARSGTRNFSLALAAVVFIALAIRLAVAIELYRNDPQVANPAAATDMATYLDLAKTFGGGDFDGPFYYQPFYYSVFLAPVFRFFGGRVWVVGLLQAALGAATAYFAGLTAAKLGGRAAGLAAALLVAFSQALVFYTPYLLIATLQTFWLAALGLLAVLALDRRRPALWLALGLVGGCSILTRGNIWLLAPALLLAAGFAVRDWRPPPGNAGEGVKVAARFWPRWAPPILLAAGIFLPQTPFMAWNTVKTGRLSGPSTAASAVLALGNTPEAPPGGRDPGTGPGPMEYPETYQSWMADKAEISVPRRILRWAWDEPLAFAELTFRKLLLFWDYREIPNNVALEHNGRKSRFLGVFGFIPSGLILALALAGAAWRLKVLPRSPRVLIPLLLLLSYWGAVAAFYNLSRFRAPALPLAAVFAGVFLARCAAAWRRRNYRRLVRRGVLPTLAAAALVFAAYDIYRHEFERLALRLARPDGVAVDIPGKGTMRLDHGPMSFGSWTPIPISPGMVVAKRFVLGAGGESTLRLPILWEAPGRAEFRINGLAAETAASQPGLGELQINLPTPDDGVFRIESLRADVQAHLIVDLQRDYRRTTLNAAPIPAELVARIYQR